MLDPSNENYVEAIEENGNISKEEIETAYQTLNDIVNVTEDDIKRAQEVKDFGADPKNTKRRFIVDLDEASNEEDVKTSTTESIIEQKSKTETNGEEASAGKDPVTQPKPLKFPTWQWQLLEAGAVLSESSVQSIVENPTFVKFNYYDPMTKKLKWSKGNNMFRCNNCNYLCFIKINK